MELKTVAQSVLNPGFPGLIGTSQGCPSLCLPFTRRRNDCKRFVNFFVRLCEIHAAARLALGIESYQATPGLLEDGLLKSLRNKALWRLVMTGSTQRREQRSHVVSRSVSGIFLTEDRSADPDRLAGPHRLERAVGDQGRLAAA